MNKASRIFLSLFVVVALVLGAGVKLDYKSADAYYPVNTFAAFTPTGYAIVTASTVSVSAVLATNGASTPQAQIAVVQNLGSNTSYVNLGASSVVATVAGGYPVLPSQTAILTVRNATHAAAITASGSSNLSITTGY